MRPAVSVILLTTLIGVGQGLFLALYTGQVYSLANLVPVQSSQQFYGYGVALSLAFLVTGLVASVFHLGHPERAWRAATQWRTSWLSREVILLPLFMALVTVYGALHYFQLTDPLFIITDTLPVDWTLVVGFLASIVAFLLFVCTAMIYASLKFLQEWHSPLTILNYALLGAASGFMLAAAFTAYLESGLVGFFATWAVVFTLFALISRGASIARNRRLKRTVDIRSAIGIRHPNMQQQSQGFTGSAFNTREFFHGRSEGFCQLLQMFYMVMVFILPVLLIFTAHLMESVELAMAAFCVQYMGLLAERWSFFAEARHPQNLYYQSMA